MARNISQIYDVMDYFIRKERGGYLTPDEAMSMLHFGQLDIYETYWDEYLRTGVLPHALEPFKSRFSFSYANTTRGILARPSDYGHYLHAYSSTWNNSQGRAIRRPFVPLNETEIDDALNSQLRPITLNNPAIVQGASNFVLYPQEPQAGYIIYLIIPVPPVLAYTENGRELVYNSAGSTQLAWDDAHLNEVIMKALSNVGINLNATDIIQFAETKTAQKLTPNG